MKYCEAIYAFKDEAYMSVVKVKSKIKAEGVSHISIFVRNAS